MKVEATQKGLARLVKYPTHYSSTEFFVLGNARGPTDIYALWKEVCNDRYFYITHKAFVDVVMRMQRQGYIKVTNDN